MALEPTRPRRAGDRISDRCAACKVSRRHTVLAAAPGKPLRVICDYCGSQHNYRGDGEQRSRQTPRGGGDGQTARPGTAPLPTVTARERRYPPMEPSRAGTDSEDLETMLRRVIREETGLTPVVPAAKWKGGDLVLRPGKPGIQEKRWPIETFFNKVVMVRNRLRVLEQQVNAAEIPDDQKIKLQGYITGCYGTLTSFNVLFEDDEDMFRGSGGID